ncbi:MAG: cysteinyl-tRNA synthetase [Solirubrobacteraceae bacterium]|nr:cysteinyl-tRNA synthetase [Solirubrobacteraceae bacterium]
MAAIRLHHTRSGALRELVPGPGWRVGIYACGLASEMTAHYLADTSALGLGPPDAEPLASEAIDAIVDFNTAQTLGALFEWIRVSNRRSEAVGRADLVEMLGVLGLEGLVEAGDAAGAPELELLERRRAGRAAKDWAAADGLRGELAERGWRVRDRSDGPELVRPEP